MAKLKTRKSILKRLRITSSGKMFCRPVSQGHFNAKESGKKTRRKRRRKEVSLVNQKRIKKMLPYI